MAAPSVKPTDIQIKFDLIPFLCGQCLKEVDKAPVKKHYLNQTIHFCSMKCFGLYSDTHRNIKRRPSTEYNLTPHPKDLQKKIEEQKEKILKGK